MKATGTCTRNSFGHCQIKIIETQSIAGRNVQYFLLQSWNVSEKSI